MNKCLLWCSWQEVFDSFGLLIQLTKKKYVFTESGIVEHFCTSQFQVSWFNSELVLLSVWSFTSSLNVHVGLLWVLWFLPNCTKTCQWTGYTKLSLDVNEHVNMYAWYSVMAWSHLEHIPRIPPHPVFPAWVLDPQQPSPERSSYWNWMNDMFVWERNSTQQFFRFFFFFQMVIIPRIFCLWKADDEQM